MAAYATSAVARSFEEMAIPAKQAHSELSCYTGEGGDVRKGRGEGWRAKGRGMEGFEYRYEWRRCYTLD